MENEELYSKLNYLHTKSVRITINDKFPDHNDLSEWIKKYKEVEKLTLEI